MLKDEDLFSNLEPLEDGGLVVNANGSRTSVEGRGTASFMVKDFKGESHLLTLCDALYVPSYAHNLLSVKRLIDDGLEPSFKHPPVIRSNDVEVPMTMRNNLYYLECSAGGQLEEANNAATADVWHSRLGHNNIQDVSKLPALVEGMKITEGSTKVCSTCATQKSKRAPIAKKWGTRVNQPMDVVHSDILGPIHVTSIDGFKYAIGFIDSYSRYTSVYLMKSRSECLEKLQQYVADVGTPKTLVTDGALEYMASGFEDFCRQRAIRHEVSTPYVPEDNGKIERIWEPWWG